MNIKWNAENYRDNFSFVYEYGEELTGMFTLGRGSRIADVGCGSGALTRKLCDMGYEVIGIDSSAEMLSLAKSTAPAASFMLADAAKFSLEKSADGIFSNAVFHWIDDLSALAKNLAANLRAGGELVCEFGGKGCAEAVHSALENIFAERGLSYRRTFNFQSIGSFAPVLEGAGLTPVFCSLFPRPTRQKGEDGLKNWIDMFLKTPFAGMEESQKAQIIAEAENRLRQKLCRGGIWYVDYVRLRLRAEKT